MMRLGLVGLMAIVIGSGCAGTARRNDGALVFKPHAWSAAPAPTQVEVASLPADRADRAAFGTVEPQGLSKYFPGLRKGTPEPAQVASKDRPSWFGPRKTKAPAQTFTTDTRAGLDRRLSSAEPSLLPVALRVPTDPSVTTTAAEDLKSTPAVNPEPVAAEASKPSKDDLDPMPPGARSDAEKPIDRMPEMPAIDPRKELVPATETAPAASEKREEAPADDLKKQADEKARQAVPATADPTRPLGLPDPMMPASYVRRETMSAPEHVHHSHADAPSPGPVLASPQVQPSSRVAPSPQAGPKPVAAVPKWKQNCLCTLIRKTCKFGEFAKLPAAKHR